MAKNSLVISVDIRETRVALIEDGIIAELHIERHRHKSAGPQVGDVVLGKVTRVLPGLQAAFIDIGHERAAFLHVEDLIRPDDFEAYLSGSPPAALTKGKPRSAADKDDTGGAIPTDEDAGAALPSSLPPAAPTGEADDDAIEAVAATDDDADDDDADDDDADDDDADDDDADDDDAIIDHADDDDDDDDDDAIIDDADDDDDAIIDHADDDDAADDDDDETLAARDGDDESGADWAAEPETAQGENGASTHASAFADDDDGVADPSSTSDDELDRTLESVHASGASTTSGSNGESTTSHALGGDERPQPRMRRLVPPAPTSSARALAEADALPIASGGNSNGASSPDVLGGDLDLDFPDMPGFTVTDPNEPAPRAPSPGGRRGGPDRRRGGRGRSRRGRTGRSPQGRSTMSTRPQNPLRISKSTPIREVVKEGQEIIVQVSKEPMGTKGARCTSHVSLPGRYVVYLPTVEHVGISKRIGSDRERARLREAIASVKPKTGGLIVRTVAEGLTKKQLKQDVGYLMRLWGEIAKKRKDAKAPSLLGGELDLVLKTARDLFTDEVHQIVIDDRAQYDRLCRFVEMFAPERLKDIHLYTGKEPLFDAYGIEDEISRALARKVPLPSGGYLIIDQAEALTAIDVNTGRFVGKGSKDMEETILKTNLEAVHEIAYQLRFRNIGGLIILDLIDMEKSSNREKVRRKLDELLQRDKAKTTLNRISDLGLIEMTRKRTRESLGRLLHEPCFYCDGTGQLQSKETIAYEILREIRRRFRDLPGYTVVVNAHPAVADVLTHTEKDALAEAENRYMRKITVTPCTDYHLEQFDLTGK